MTLDKLQKLCDEAAMEIQTSNEEMLIAAVRKLIAVARAAKTCPVVLDDGRVVHGANCTLWDGTECSCGSLALQTALAALEAP